MNPRPSLAAALVALVALVAAHVPGAVRAAGPAADPDRHAIDDIERRAADHLRALHADAAGARVEVRPLDRRLRLARCGVEPDVGRVGARQGRPAWGAIVVEVSCPGAPGWRVRVRAHVTVEREAWVLLRGVRRGETLSAGLLGRQPVVLGDEARGARRAATGLADALPIDALDAVLGQEFVRDLRAGSVPTTADLLPPLLVRRGARVRLHRGDAGLSVETRAEALADARIGERVGVRNVRTGRRLDAVVVGPDEVAIR